MHHINEAKRYKFNNYVSKINKSYMLILELNWFGHFKIYKSKILVGGQKYEAILAVHQK